MELSNNELLNILIALGDSLRREDDIRPNVFWIEDLNALRHKVREELRRRNSGHVA